jgi:hypothetical protein
MQGQWSVRSRWLALLGVVVVLAWPALAQAQIIGIIESRAAGYFSTDDQFVLGGPANWFTDPAGQAPLPPGTYPNPPFATGNALPGINGVNWVPMPRSYFGNNITANGTTTTATAITAAFINNGAANSPNDAAILVPNNSFLSSTNNLLNYVQINFSVDYDIGAAFGLNPGFAQARYITWYNVPNVAGAFAAVDATLWYWRINNLGVPQANLGSLNLSNIYLPGTAGFDVLNDIQFIGGITPAQAAAGDNLRIVGYFRLRVDPADIQLTSVPEPGTLALLGLIGAGYGGFRWYRRSQTQRKA